MKHHKCPIAVIAVLLCSLLLNIGLPGSAAASENDSSRAGSRIAERNSDVIIPDQKGRARVVSSTTQFLTGPAARISQPAEPAASKSTDNSVSDPAAQKPPSVAEAILEAAEILEQQGNLDCIALYEKAGNAGVGYAFYRIGRIYLHGNLQGAEKNTAKAMDYFKKGVGQVADPVCAGELGGIYLAGDVEGIEKNIPMAIKYYRFALDRSKGRWCSASRADVSIKLGCLLADRGDFEEAATRLEAGRDVFSDSKYANETLARIYLAKADKTTDAEASAAYLDKAVKLLEETKGPGAKYRLYLLAAQGRLALDAATLLDQAVAEGSLAAKFDADYGLLSPEAFPDSEEFKESAKKAEAEGSPAAMFALAALAEKKGSSASEVLRLLKGAASAGHAGAQYQLGMDYLHGKYSKKDASRAAKLFEKAIASGHSGASYELGRISQSGLIGPRDMRRAIQLYADAAKAGEPNASYALARIYAMGKAGDPAPKAAADLYLASAMGGNKNARADVLTMYFATPGADQGAQVVQLIKDAANKADIFAWTEELANDKPGRTAQIYLAKCHADGIGTEKAPAKAADLFLKASVTDSASLQTGQARE